MSSVGETCSSLRCTVCLWSKGMVEVVAENYHNIWAKKKKSDLGSRGDLSEKSIIVSAYYREIPANVNEWTICGVGGCGSASRLLLCLCAPVSICMCLPRRS